MEELAPVPIGSRAAPAPTWLDWLRLESHEPPVVRSPVGPGASATIEMARTDLDRDAYLYVEPPARDAEPYFRSFGPCTVREPMGAPVLPFTTFDTKALCASSSITRSNAFDPLVSSTMLNTTS